jgi:hypothetical protein
VTVTDILSWVADFITDNSLIFVIVAGAVLGLVARGIKGLLKSGR